MAPNRGTTIRMYYYNARKTITKRIRLRKTIVQIYRKQMSKTRIKEGEYLTLA